MHDIHLQLFLPVELKGQRSRVLLMSNDHRISEIMNINNYSTMIKLLRITALLVLFGNRLRKQKNEL